MLVTVRVLRALWRLLRLAAHVLAGMATVVWCFPHWDGATRARRIQRWSARGLAILGVQLNVRGQPPADGPRLIVSNHISWLDVLVILAACPCRFVAKAEVHHWPVLGRLVAGAGTLFIERERKRDALRVVHRVVERLRAGDVVALFPEGTTSDGHTVLPFHANLLQAALATDVPVQPVGLAYRPVTALPEALVRHDAVIYVGDMTLLASLWRVATAHDVVACLHWGSAQCAAGRDRRTWASALRAEVARLAGLPPPVEP